MLAVSCYCLPMPAVGGTLACSLQTFSSLQLFGAGPSATMHSILPLSLSLESCHHICSTGCGQLVSQLQGCVLALRGMAGDR